MAEKHGVAQYVGILAAQMMQESAGAGNDPMQAAGATRFSISV
ncbi:lysozyme family protein [Bacillus cereus]|nr:lysozyme family protein [Bacillus cereus]MEC2511954.1 lysozyme family protein [Bacillus cereus]